MKSASSRLNSRSGKGRILQLKARSHQREYDLFCRLRDQVGEQATAIRDAARAIASLDALAGLAELAATQGYCRPELTGGRCLEIEGGRHPVVEQLLSEQAFVPNSVALGDSDKPDLVVLTGPNASGKSCYLRQCGVLQLMAQMGSWIPAERAAIGLADRIFTRVGAVDDLASGQSTFMVEMAETANILQHASERSLVLLDEIGRGTATFDGLSIAWAVAEHLASATPWPRGTQHLCHPLPRAQCARRQPQQRGQLPSGCGRTRRRTGVSAQSDAWRGRSQLRDRAARLAGVPPAVVQRARQVLERIEGVSRWRADPAKRAAARHSQQQPPAQRRGCPPNGSAAGHWLPNGACYPPHQQNQPACQSPKLALNPLQSHDQATAPKPWERCRSTPLPQGGPAGQQQPSPRPLGSVLRELSAGAHCKTLWTGLANVRAAIGATAAAAIAVSVRITAPGPGRDAAAVQAPGVNAAAVPKLDHHCCEPNAPTPPAPTAVAPLTQQGLDPLDAFREDRMVQVRR